MQPRIDTAHGGGSVREVRAFAPATVSNLGPGFDVLGLAVAELGDRVIARASARRGVIIKTIRGDEGRLPLDPDANTAAIAARATLALTGLDAGVELEIDKGLPIGSGLGSSAASAVAAAYAVNALLGSPLRKKALIEPCLDAEAAVSGRHADNVAPSLLGGLILVRGVEPLDLIRLPVPEGLTVVVVTPAVEVLTREARAVLPADVSLAQMVKNGADLAAFVSACHANDLGLLARCIGDDPITRARAPLIPGCARVIDAALEAGALGSSISGAGPSIFALCRSAHSAARVAAAMQAAFSEEGVSSRAHVSPADCPGVRLD
jgi:homoserine kinase